VAIKICQPIKNIWIMNRIDKLFKTKKNNILSIYITAGYPKFNDTISIIKNLDAAGVDMIEIGFPFSDPLADGPVIQNSSQTAIENEMGLAKLFYQLKDIRKITQIPLILMGYLNPVMQYGEEAFIEKCKETGIDGIIIPDMPLRYYQTNLMATCKKEDVYNILLITPETQDERIFEIDKNSNGFIYMVSSNSITGNNNSEPLIQYFDRIKSMQLKNPALIGFGIHDHAGFNRSCHYGSGAIIGSAFINHINTCGTSAESIQQFIKQIRP
jgi:tryptophan synthase alpha chain